MSHKYNNKTVPVKTELEGDTPLSPSSNGGLSKTMESEMESPLPSSPIYSSQSSETEAENPPMVSANDASVTMATSETDSKPKRKRRKMSEIDARPFLCQFTGCDKTYASESALRTHRKKKHPAANPAPSPKQPCVIAPASSLATVSIQRVVQERTRIHYNREQQQLSNKRKNCSSSSSNTNITNNNNININNTTNTQGKANANTDGTAANDNNNTTTTPELNLLPRPIRSPSSVDYFNILLLKTLPVPQVRRFDPYQVNANPLPSMCQELGLAPLFEDEASKVPIK